MSDKQTFRLNQIDLIGGIMRLLDEQYPNMMVDADFFNMVIKNANDIKDHVDALGLPMPQPEGTN